MTHNLKTVIGFEIKRTIKKKTFWFAVLGMPVLFAAIVAIIIFSNNNTQDKVNKILNNKDNTSLDIMDDSDQINKHIFMSSGFRKIVNKEVGVSDVKGGKVDAFIYYPKDIANNSIEVYANSKNFFEDSKYDAIAKSLLKDSVQNKVSPNLRAILTDKINLRSTLYKDGKQYNIADHLLVPVIFFVAFYFSIAFLGNQMLTSATEEKENKVIEILLVTVKPKTLIIGKFISFIAIAAIQILIMLLPIVIAYILFKDKLPLINMIDLSMLNIDPVSALIAVVLFVLSYSLFSILLITISAAMPTAKEAGQYFGVVMFLIFGPLYLVSMIVSSADSLVIQALSYFPLTAPVVLMIRNIVGNLSISEFFIGSGAIVIAIVAISWIATRVFKYAIFEYSKKVSLRNIFSR